MERNFRLDALSTVPLLASLPLQEREGLLDRLEEVPYANGETILAEGDTTYAFFYIVKRGHVAISKELAPSRAISQEAAPAATLPSATQGSGLGASQVSEAKVSEAKVS